MTIGDLAGIGREPWMDGALCPQVDGDCFFPNKGESAMDAKAVCIKCPVRLECWEHCVKNDERYGVWAGVTETERRRYRRSTPAGQVPPIECFHGHNLEIVGIDGGFRGGHHCRACERTRENRRRRALLSVVE